MWVVVFVWQATSIAAMPIVQINFFIYVCIVYIAAKLLQFFHSSNFFQKKLQFMFYMVVSGVYVFWKLFVEPKKISHL